MAAGLAAGPALAQTGAAQPPDPRFDASRKAFESLPEGERIAIQDALVWAGTYAGTTDGSFGRRTYDAITGFETRAKLNADGILEPNERAYLANAAQRARDAVSFTITGDPVSGARIGIPKRFLDKAVPGKTGTSFTSNRDRISLVLFSYPGTGTDLGELYDTLKADLPPAKRVSYKLLRPDFFVVSGVDNGRRFFTRVAKGAPGLRGFTFSYADDAGPAFERLTIAIANSFDPFPKTPVGPAASTPAVAAGPAAAPPAAVPPRPQLAGTGLAVAPGRVLTTAAAAAACPRPLINNAAAVVGKTDAGSGLALLTGTAKPAPLAAGDPLAPGDAVTIPTFVAADGTAASAPPRLQVVAGTVGASSPDLRIVAPLQGQPSGSPVLDATGRLAGLVMAAPHTLPQVAGIVPQATYEVVPHATIAAFLTGAGVILPADAGAPTSRTTGEIVAAWSPSLVAITCAAGAP